MSHTSGRPMPVATEEHRQYIFELNDEARTRKANIAKLRARIATGSRQDLESVYIEPSHISENATGAEQMRREIAQLKAQLKDAAAELKAKDEEHALEIDQLKLSNPLDDDFEIVSPRSSAKKKVLQTTLIAWLPVGLSLGNRPLRNWIRRRLRTCSGTLGTQSHRSHR